MHKLIEPIGTDSRIRYIKFGGNIKEYEYFYKFEIKYYGKIVLTDPFNHTVVVVHDLPRQDSVLRRARVRRSGVMFVQNPKWSKQGCM